MLLALRLAASIDELTAVVARIVRWGLLANALLIAANAISRKVFSVAWASAFDMQWQFFAAVVLLMAAYTFQRDEHVRLDILAHRLGERRMAWLDLGGIFLVLIPVCAAMVWATWPHFMASLLTGESRATRESTSSIPAWIIKGMIPLGFGLLALQGLAEAVRCVACIRRIIHRPVDRRQLIEGSNDE
jgi:TRAP-type mannitol/chloroaromatic compound transport system permease small subunit